MKITPHAKQIVKPALVTTSLKLVKPVVTKTGLTVT
jgi:hypothetical protein